MLREKFTEIISEALYNGYRRGVDVFMEGLEEDLAKSEVFEEGVTTENIIDFLMEDAGYTVVEESTPEKTTDADSK